MNMESLQIGSVGYKGTTVTSTARGGCPKQRTGQMPVQSRPPFLRPVDTMTDSQSYGFMEERYGIQEEGIF